MKAYKGFNEKLQCRDFQYELGEEYEEPKAELCETGFHACENPIDVFNYYPPSDNRYCEVELEDVTREKGDDSKVCGRKIKICAEIGIKGIIDAFVKFTLEKADWKIAIQPIQATTVYQPIQVTTVYQPIQATAVYQPIQVTAVQQL